RGDVPRPGRRPRRRLRPTRRGMVGGLPRRPGGGDRPRRRRRRTRPLHRAGKGDRRAARHPLRARLALPRRPRGALPPVHRYARLGRGAGSLMSRGYVVDERTVESRPESGTAQARVTIDGTVGCERLEQRVLRFAPGRSGERTTGERQEVLYVASGSGVLHTNGDGHQLEPDTGAFLVPGDRYEIENAGPDELV